MHVVRFYFNILDLVPNIFNSQLMNSSIISSINIIHI